MASTSPQLEKATSLVTELWFPFDRSILASINNQLSEKSFEEVRSKITTDIQSDLSIFLLCLKEFSALVGEKYEIKEDDAIRDYFSEMTEYEFKEVIKRVSSFRIAHRMDDATEIQRQRMTEMHVSGLATKEISRAKDISSEVAFNSSVLRQLGATLIAWNYPTIYEKVVSRTHTQASHDQDLKRSLGFSPMMVGAAVANRWNLSPFYTRVLGGVSLVNTLKGPLALTRDQKDFADSIVKICEIGEALARSTNPELFSSAVEDLEFATEYISDVIGDDGVKKILIAARNTLQGLKGKSLDRALDNSSESLKRKIANVQFSKGLLAKNSYIDELSADVRVSVESLYNKISPDGSVAEYVTIYTKEVIPKTIFSSIAVFLFDPFEDSLYPSLLLGKSKILVPKSIQLAGRNDAYNIIRAGFGLKTPLKEEQMTGEGQEVIALACALGMDQPIGVFYAEIPVTEQTESLDSVRYFKAMKYLLADCLRLESSD